MKRSGTLVGTVALAVLGVVMAGQALGAGPAPSQVTSQLVEAARKEGKVVFYTAMDIQVAEGLAKAFEAKYTGITAQVERSGAERIFQRVSQEYASNIRAVDVIESSDVAHFLYYKRQGWLVPYVPEDVSRWPAEARGADGLYASNRATLSVVGYNTKLVKPEEAPKSYADLLDPKWSAKIVKAHPGYSGNVMTATFVLSQSLGWDYLKKLGQQRIMQVQSSTDPPKKLALGERPLMFDGNEYNALILKAQGAPIAIVYPTEGTPLVAGSAGVMKDSPHPSAARLFVSYLFSREGQQVLVEKGQLRSFHPEVKEPSDRVRLAEIKTRTADPEALEKAIQEIKRRYTEYFGT
jgi:iron(III) transport system substrate-binding protein